MSNFVAFDYLYLNPELSAYLGIFTVEQALTYYNANSNKRLAFNLSVVPSNFNPDIFISTARDLTDTSSLSQTIYTSMMNQGLTAVQISRKQKYIPSVYQSISYSNSNKFYINASNFFTNKNLQPNDTIRVIDSASTEMFFKVVSVSSNNFTVESNSTLLYLGSNYLFFGITVTDYDRMSQINYARIMGGYSNLNSNGNYTSSVSTSNTNYLSVLSDNNFNPLLYRTLYTDARSLNDGDTYLDWVNKRKNEIYRIKNVDDVAFGNGNAYVNMNFLNISSNITFRGKYIDGIISNMDPTSCNIPGDSNKVVTEYAIKNYTDIRVSNLQSQGSFNNVVINDAIIVKTHGTFSNNVNIFGSLFVNSNSSFSNDLKIAGNVFVYSNLDVTGPSTFRNSVMLTNGNATFSNSALVNGSMSVTGNFYNARIGLGHLGNFLTSNNGFSIIQAQNYNDNSDARIKKDITLISPKSCLDILNTLDVKEFSFNYGHKDMDTKKTIGLIAQEVPDKFVYHTDGYLPDKMIDAVIDQNRIYIENVYDQPHLDAINEGEQLKIIVNDTDFFVTVTKKYEKGVYEIKPAFYELKNARCLIYGSHTSSLKNVDYKQLFVLALGAIKELKTELDSIRYKI